MRKPLSCQETKILVTPESDPYIYIIDKEKQRLSSTQSLWLTNVPRENCRKRVRYKRRYICCLDRNFIVLQMTHKNVVIY